jgi:hypothetical protein
MEAGEDRNRDGAGGGEGGCLLAGIFGLLGTLACGFLVPFVGLSLAALSGRKVAALVFAGALGLSVLAGAAIGVLSRDSLRSIRDELAPPTSTSVRRPMPCQEHSGGDNRCPGG